ncbi:unnamed protein product, partial [marine sediment metagenome]
VGYEDIPSFKFDVVISGQTIEHVKQPWEWVKSLTRYYRKYICIIAPNTCEEHKYPIDTFRFLPDGIRELFEWAEIKPLEIFANGKDTIGIGTNDNT